MFDRMDIVESIYEGVVSLSYEKLLGHNPTVLDSVGKKIGESASSNAHPATDGRAGKRCK